jgi:uncharacterized membrane protein (UPF0127 family)
MAPQRLLIVFLALLIAAGLGGCGEVRSAPHDGFERVTIDGETFRLELAADVQARGQGLMHREMIPEDGGMLFVFPRAEVRSFWMGYCLVDIDVLFLDPQGRITAMHQMKAEPPRQPDESRLAYERRLHRVQYWSGFPAQFAIELRGGTLDRLDVEVDDKIDLDLERLKAMVR